VPELLAALGRTHRADTAGRLRLPLPADRSLLAAEDGDEFALAELVPQTEGPPEDRVVRLALAPSHELTIEVVDEAGRPLAGVPVSLRFSDENFSFDFLRALTGADGVARMKHALAFLEASGPGADMPCSAAIVTPQREPVQQRLDLEHPPADPVRLVMPASGTVEVEVVRSDGAAAEEGQLVFLSRPQHTAEDDDDFFIPGLPGFDSVAARVAGGRAVFGFVGLGLDLQATTVYGDAPESSRVRARGPERAGETALLRLVESLDYPVLAGRLLGPDSAPLAGLRAEFHVAAEEDVFGIGSAHATVTAADGGFRLALPSHARIPTAQPAEFRIGAGAAAGALVAEFELPPLVAGENALGDLRAREAAVLVSGRVVGAGGAPVPGATLCPMEWVQWDEDDPTDGTWLDEWDKSRDAGPDGSFVFYGDPPAAGLRLAVSAPGFLGREVEAAPGTRDLLIRLDAGGSLRGRLLVDEGVPVDELNLALLVPGSGFEDEEQLWTSAAQEDGSFAFHGLRPGSARLSVALSWEGKDENLVARVDGIAVGPGAEQDPRLDPLDLRGRLHHCRIRARGEDGERVEELRAWREEAPDSSFHGWAGEVLVMSTQPLARLTVSAPGWRRQTVDAAQPVVDVRLRRGPELLLAVPPAAARADGAALGVQIVSRSDGDWSELPRGFFAADGTLRLHLQEPGDYGVVFLAARGGPPDPDDWDFAWIEPDGGGARESFIVRDVAGAQSFTLAPPSAEALRTALAERGERVILPILEPPR
jgi:hypothetical protein